MGSIHVTGVNTVLTISAGVQNLLRDMRTTAANAGKAGGLTKDEFHGYLLEMQTRLDILKKVLDAVEQAVRSFHRP